MTAEPNRDLPSSAFDAPAAPSRALTIWTGEGRRGLFASIFGRFGPYLPYALALLLLLGGGFAVATVATAPALTDGVDEVAAVDARGMGMAVNLDPSGQQAKDQAKASSLTRDVGTLKTEIARLTRALDQSKANQASLTKTTTGQAAANRDEVSALKGEVANLQKTLDATRDAAASKIEALAAKVDQPRNDDPHIAELRDRLDRIEKTGSIRSDGAKTDARTDGRLTEAKASDVRQPEKAAPNDPATTGSVPQASERGRESDGPVVRNWTVRDVGGGVALLEGRHGMIEVMRGARAPGVGRIRAIERRDGQWVVVTDRGVILQR